MLDRAAVAPHSDVLGSPRNGQAAFLGDCVRGFKLFDECATGINLAKTNFGGPGGPGENSRRGSPPLSTFRRGGGPGAPAASAESAPRSLIAALPIRAEHGRRRLRRKSRGGKEPTR